MSRLEKDIILDKGGAKVSKELIRILVRLFY